MAQLSQCRTLLGIAICLHGLSLEADVSVTALCSIREGQIADGCLALAVTAGKKVIA